MTVVTLDSNDITGILADAGVTLDTPATASANAEAGKESTEATKPAPAPEDPDDVEGENGLTPREDRDLTEKTRKAVGKQHRLRREAEEFAASEYRERRLAEERATKFEREIAELKAQLAPAKETPKDAEQPQRQNFGSEEAYVDAMIQWGVDKRLAEKAQEDQEAREKREYQARIDTAATRIRSAIELVPDFEDVVGKSDLQLPAAIGTYLEESEMVAELSYYIAKNPDVLVSLSKLSPHSQLVKIGKIESTLTPFEPRKEAQHDDTSSQETSSGKVAKTAPSAEAGIDLSKPRSKAAPVITPLDGSGSAGVSKDSKDMNIRESIEDFAKRNKANFGARKRH